MATTLGAPLLAFLIALAITLAELVTSRYPRTFSFLVRSVTLWAYGLVYALAAGVITSVLRVQTGGAETSPAVGLSNPWVQAAAVGMTTKAFFHIRFFSTPGGTPVGVESIVALFEPWLLRLVQFEEFERVREYVQPRASRIGDLGGAQRTILDNLPPDLSDQEKGALATDLAKTTTPLQAMELYLRFAGRRGFARLFP